MPAACAIVVEQLDDGRWRATCPVFPELETVAATAAEARAAFEDAIGRQLTDQAAAKPS